MDLDGGLPSAATAAADRSALGEASDVVVTVRGISKRFANTQALRSVDLDVRSAEVHVLLGENGAGKSTLAKVVAGIVVPDAGRVELGGRAVAFRTPRQARQAGVEIVHQETTVIPKMTVEENVTLGNEHRFTKLGVLHRTNLRRATRDLLEQVAPHLDPGTAVERLTGSEKHLVAVAKALLTKPRLLILDEPTAALDEMERTALFDVVHRAREGGTAVLYVTHHLDEVPKVGDRVTVMRDGSVVAECDPSTPEMKLVAHIAGREVSLTRPTGVTAARQGDVLLELEGVCVGHGLRDVSLAAHAGEILGIYGVGQCGTHELAEVLSGHRRPDSGRVRVNGKDMVRPTVDKALDRGLAYLPGERGRKGIVPTLSVGENISLSNLRRLTRLGFIDRKRSSRYAEELSDRVHVRGGSSGSPITALSGGNQQKALLARALGCETPVLLLDDPTVGVDVGSREEIYGVLRDVVRSGRAVVVITSDLLELLSLADRAVVMYRGRLTGEFSGASLDEQQVLQAALGAGIPAQAAASH